MLKHWNLAVAALWLTAACATAHAEDKNCDASLFKYVGTINKEDMVHFFDLVNRENYDESKHNAGASHAGVFGADYDEFNAHRISYRNEYRYNIDRKFSKSYAMSHIQDSELRAYVSCLDGKHDLESVIIHLDRALDASQNITFVVAVNSTAEPTGLNLNIFNAGKVLAKPDRAAVSSSGRVTRISMDQFSGRARFTVERSSQNTEFLVTATIAQTAMAESTLVIGPVLKKSTQWVESPVSIDGALMYMARELDWVYAVDGNNGMLPNKGRFEGNACLCANGKRASADLPLDEAGVCEGMPGDAVIKKDSVTFSSPTASTTDDWMCGNHVQRPVRLTRSGPDGVCYTVEALMKWNAGGRNSCTVRWTLQGILQKKETVFAN